MSSSASPDTVPIATGTPPVSAAPTKTPSSSSVAQPDAGCVSTDRAVESSDISPGATVPTQLVVPAPTPPPTQTTEVPPSLPVDSTPAPALPSVTPVDQTRDAESLVTQELRGARGVKRCSSDPQLLNEKSVKCKLCNVVDWARPVGLNPDDPVLVRSTGATTKSFVMNEAQARALAYWGAFGKSQLSAEDAAAAQEAAGQPLVLSSRSVSQETLNPRSTMLLDAQTQPPSAREYPTPTGSGEGPRATRQAQPDPRAMDYPPPSHHAHLLSQASHTTRRTQTLPPLPPQSLPPPPTQSQVSPQSAIYAARTTSSQPIQFAFTQSGVHHHASVMTEAQARAPLLCPPPSEQAAYDGRSQFGSYPPVDSVQMGQPPQRPSRTHASVQPRHVHDGFGIKFSNAPTPAVRPVVPMRHNIVPTQPSSQGPLGYGIPGSSTPAPIVQPPATQTQHPATSAMFNVDHLWQQLGNEGQQALLAHLGVQHLTPGIAQQPSMVPRTPYVPMAQPMEVDQDFGRARVVGGGVPPVQPHFPNSHANAQFNFSMPISQNGREPSYVPSAQTPKTHLTVTLMNRIDGIEESLEAQVRAQTDIMDGLKMVQEKLGQLSLGSPQTPHKPSAPEPRRSARASRSKASRIILATTKVEYEDFKEELGGINSDGEDDLPHNDGSPSRPPKQRAPRPSKQRASKPSTSTSSPDGWQMPHIAPTTLEEEAVMVSLMTPAQRANVEVTFVNRLQDAVRKHMLWLLGAEELSEIGKKCPTLTDEEVAQYEANKVSYFTRQNFRIDFKRSWARCSFNRGARDFFTRHFLESVAGGSYRTPFIPTRYFTYDQAVFALDSHMEHARLCWRQAVDPPSQAKLARRALMKAINGRKRTLLHSRAWIIATYALEEHYELFFALMVEHMSGDEVETIEDRRSSIYVIIEAAWQSELMKTFLRTLDARYIEDWASGLVNRHHGGRAPRRRYAKTGAKVDDNREVPVGLWRNCYDSAWLDRQPAHRIRDLRIIDGDYDFKLDFSKGTISTAKAQEVLDVFMKGAEGGEGR